MVDNFKQINKLLEWNNSDEFYFLSVIQRKKDAKEGVKVNGTNNNSRLIKAYFVKSLDYLEFIKPEVIELCNLFNARAGINLNKRSFKKTALQNLKLVTDNLINENYDKVYKTYTSACGKFSHDKNKKWIIDLDGEEQNDPDYVRDLGCFVNDIVPHGDKIIDRIPSKSGSHLIVKPFNLSKFKEKYTLIDVQKNNPTNIFIP